MRALIKTTIWTRGGRNGGKGLLGEKKVVCDSTRRKILGKVRGDEVRREL